MVQKDSGGQKAFCGHQSHQCQSQESRVLKTGCLHNLGEGHGQALSRETGQGISGKEWLASNNLKAPRRKEGDRAQVRRMNKKICRGRQGRQENCQASVERPAD